MTETDKLRAGLDARRIEYEIGTFHYGDEGCATSFMVPGLQCGVAAVEDMSGTMDLWLDHLDAAQALAALDALGRDER